MLRILSVILGALALANGNVVTRSQRNGESNRYFLYTSDVIGEELTVGSTSTNFVDTRKTVVIVHGHDANYQTSLNPDLIRTLLNSGEELNIIAVDWSIYAAMSYTFAEVAVPSIAYHLVAFLQSVNVDPGLTHLIGFNLGAHVVGYTGRRLNGVARITGLDPSKTLILNRLGQSDANYVEVIHTDIKGVNSNADQMGHADFYPNGGGNQPGCYGNRQCNHDRAWMLYLASIDGKVFNARCCRSILLKNLNWCFGCSMQMGDNTLSKIPCATGIYRVNTGSRFPY